MRLGIDSFSVRWQEWDAFQIIDYAASLGLDNVHFSERAHLGGLEQEALVRIKEYASERSLGLEIGMRSFNWLSSTFDASLGTGEHQLVEMIEAAAIIGSPIVRCFVGMQRDRALAPVDQLIDETILTLTRVASRAESANVAIAVENHGGVDLLATELRAVIEAVGSSHVRVCLDTGNPVYAAEDAVYATEVLAPYTVSTHLRDTLAWLTPAGAMVQWAPVGRGNVDIQKIIGILQATDPSIPIDLEIITAGEPKEIDFNDPDSPFWSLYPDMPARSLARFLTFAAKGSPQHLEQQVVNSWPPPIDQIEMFKRQQLDHFEESVAYCRTELGIQQSPPR